MSRSLVFSSRSAAETKSLGRRLASLLKPGDRLGLRGPLGAGKTTFVQGLAKGLGCREVPSSPTFVLAQSYHGRMTVHHLDFYRVQEREILGMGLEDFYRDEAVTAIEWIERAPHLLPAERLDVVFSYTAAGSRKISFAPRGSAWVARLKEWK